MKKFLSLFLPVALIFCACFCLGGCAENKSARTAYVIDCELTGNTLVGKEEVTFYNFTDNAFSELKFNLFGNAFRKGAEYSPIAGQYAYAAYPSGESYGSMTITEASGENGALKYEICGDDENILSVKLEEEIFPEESVTVTIGFTLTLADVIARTGINADAINLANFYPALCGVQNGAFYECVYYANGDPFYSDCADFTVTLTVASNYVAASSGKVTATTVKNGKTSNVYSLKNARSFAFVLSKKFETITDKSTGIDINYYYYADETPEKSLKAAVDAINYFNETFGEYPYPSYSVVQTKFIQGGMEFPALVMVSDSLDEKAKVEVVVHETAHQWWQTVVGNNEIEYGFLDEGLAEYSVILFYENHLDYGFTRAALVDSAEKTYKTFCSVYDKLFGKVNTVMTRSLKDFGSEYEYVNVAYIKSAVMYDVLRSSIGDEKFFGGLKKYYEANAFLNATPNDLVAAFNKAGADSEGFFAGFFDGKAII